MHYDAYPAVYTVNVDRLASVIRMFHPSITRPKLLMLAVAAALASAAPRAEGLLEETVMADMDWQPMKAIPLAEQDLACRQCGGRYLDPLAKVDLSQSPTEADLEVYADDTEVTEGELLFPGKCVTKTRLSTGHR